MAFKMNGSHWQVLVSFMENHESFAKGKFSGPTGKAVQRQLWERLSSELNVLGFGSRTVETWQKSWADIKYNLKKKAANNKKDFHRTGGGSAKETPLSEWEQKILGILGTTFYEGVNSRECGIPEDTTEAVNSGLYHTNTSRVEYMATGGLEESPGKTDETLLQYTSTSQVQQRELLSYSGEVFCRIKRNSTRLMESRNHDHEYLPKAEKKKTQADVENEIFKETLSELKLIRLE